MIAPRYNSVVTEGATVHELAIMFNKDLRDVRKALRVAEIKGHNRGGEAIYSVATAATHLVRFDETNIDALKRLLHTHHDQLPVQTRKEYWTALTLEQKYLREKGDLWSTSEILILATTLCRGIRTSMELLPDSIDREAGLTERQRDVMQRTIDTALNELVVTLDDAFADTQSPVDSGSAFASEADDPDGGL